MKNLIILTFLMSALSVFSQEWKLAKDKNGVKVLTRLREGSKLKEFKASIDMNASVEKISAEIKNVNNHTVWLKDIIKSELGETFENGYYSFYELNLPWPATNRDMYIKTSESKTINGVELQIVSASDKKEEDKGVIRMKQVGGKWSISKNDDGTTHVFYTFFADPSGSLPTWAINMFIVDGPYESLLNLKELMEK